MTEEEIKAKLTPEEYHVLREGGTEKAFDNLYWDYHGEGVFRCKVCGEELFRAEHKYDSGTGWPSFDQPIQEGAVAYRDDNSHGMHRVEVLCANCGSHLGHMFSDGPKETTGTRYCMNSCSLELIKD